jgi:excisionase family DNA binding protein
MIIYEKIRRWEMDEKLLDKKELAEWLGISIPTIDRWRKDGLPFIQTGKLVRFQKTKVQSWLDERSHNQK